MNDNKNILFMFRLYDGFYNSLKDRVWKPTGVPAISNLLEKITKENGINSLIYFYIPYRQNYFKKNQKIFIKELNSFVYILVSPFFTKIIPEKFSNLLNIFYFAIFAFLLSKFKKIDLFFSDRSNIFSAALITRILKKNTIIRILGMPRPYFEYLNKKKIVPILLSYAFKTNFNHVIATFDGSSINEFCKFKLSSNTNLDIIPNGVIKKQFSNLKVSKKINILFLSRLEKNKGIELLLQNISRLPVVYRDKIKVHIIGAGSQFEECNQLINKNNLNKIIKLYGAIEHKKVLTLLRQFDIYLSFNTFGQLSNANLEAISAGLCMIISKTNKKDDEYVKRFGLNNQFVKWFDPNDNYKSLKNILINFIKNPNQMINLKKKTRKLSEKIPDLDNRIDWEINLIKKIIFKKC